MGNISGTNARKDSVVIAAIVDEKNKWHETLSGAKRPDMSLINDMLFNTYQRLHGYMQQIHVQSVEIQTDPDKRMIELEEKLEKLQTEKDALTLRESIRRDSSRPIATSDQVPGRKGIDSRPISTSDQVPGRTGNGSMPISTSDQVPGRKDSSSRPISTSDQEPGRKKANPLDMGKLSEKPMIDNPNITDLSDMNRPTKLGEVYTELYDNAWTDAYEALMRSGHKDTEAIKTLLKTLKIHSTAVGIQTDQDRRTIELEDKLEKLQTEKEALTIRLSRIVEEKLMKDNSNITDLSDKNRPTKLAEVYTEIYDNEWTDAYEALTGSGYNDTEAIETLLKTLKACFEFCQSNANQLLESTVKTAANVLFQEVHEQMKDPKKLHQKLAVVYKGNRYDVGVSKLFFFKTLSLQCRWKSKNSDETKDTLDGLGTIYQPQSFEEELKRIRKQMSVVLIPVVQNAFLKTYWDDSCIHAMKPFIKNCLFLCWMMVVQGPPMCFDWSTKQGSQLDANLYRHYTASGTVVEFVVWPAMFLHKEGPIIAKGTVQPYVGKNS